MKFANNVLFIKKKMDKPNDKTVIEHQTVNKDISKKEIKVKPKITPPTYEIKLVFNYGTRNK